MDDARKRDDGREAGTGGLAGRAWRAAYLLLALTALFWGGNAVSGRLAVGEISPMALVCIRWVMVVLVMLPFAGRGIVRHWDEIRASRVRIVAMGAIGFTIFNTALYVSAHYTTAVNITIFQGSIPVIVLFGALAVHGTRIAPLQLVGMAVTLVGVATVAAQGSLATLLALEFNPGDLIMLGGCVLYAGYTLALRNRPPIPPLVFFTLMAIVALLTSLPLLAFEAAIGATIWPGPFGWAILVYVALFPSLLAQLFFMRGVELIGPGRAGLFVNLVPVFGAMLAVLVLGEPFHVYHALALALVLGGIALAERGRG